MTRETDDVGDDAARARSNATREGARGACAGTVARAVTHPMDTVKARAQVTTEEVTVTEVSGSVAAPMPEDDSVKVRTNASWRLPGSPRKTSDDSTSRLATP